MEEGEEEEVLLTACNIWVVLAKWHASLNVYANGQRWYGILGSWSLRHIGRTLMSRFLQTHVMHEMM